MDDFRMGDSGNLWIWILLAFLLFSNWGSGCGVFGGSGGNSLGGLFNGCGNNTFMWIILAVLVYFFFMND